MKLVICALFTLVPALCAQQPLITLDTQATSPQLQRWLHSGDPRLIAWSATLTAKQHDKTILAEMPPLLEHWTIPSEIGYSLDEPQKEQRRAAEAVLDTLIQENAAVPVSTIRSIAEFFPDQALILVARLPLAETASLLRDWTYQATGPWAGRILARVASMMLAKEPTANFITGILRDSEEELRVTIAAPEGGGLAAGAGACGDSVGGKLASGWPEVFSYGLEENNPYSTGSLVVELDGDKIQLQRHSEKGWGSCFGVESLDRATRHRLIAHWLGLKADEMPWQPTTIKKLQWTTGAAYQQQLGTLIETERQKLQSTVDTLMQRGLIKEGISPRLTVAIACDLKPCPLVPAPTPATGIEPYFP